MKPWPERLVLLGHPLGHSLSPVFQNAALHAAAIPLVYEPLDTPRSALDDTIAALRRARAAGNVTTPYKESMLARCDRLTEVARAVGAVNTFWTAPDGALVGDNTDVEGFQAAAEQLLGPPPAGAIVALLGAGGAAAAILHALERWPAARVRVYARTTDRAQTLVKRFMVPASLARSAEEAVDGATLLVNATPVGFKEETMPVRPDAIPNGCAVLDLVYRAGETPLVRAAKARGLRAMDGMIMLVEQGALAFERWFGMAADRGAMWASLQARR